MPTLTLNNKNLQAISTDYLYHLGINIPNTKDTSDIQKQFGDVKFVCMGGTKERMAELAKHLRQILNIDVNSPLVDLTEHACRYALFKVGPILCCSHGIGMSTMSVVLHELLKLVMYAKCDDPIFIRIGTCGGLGLEPGTVVVTEKAYNGYLKSEYEIAVLGERIIRPAYFDANIVNAIVQCADKKDDFNTVIGNTMGTDCFYEGQGRLDGASCDYTEDQKMDFLRRCSLECGIKNIEMESPMFASLCLHVGIKAADICVTLIDRLKGDQIPITMEQKHAFEKRPLIIVGRYIQSVLYEH